MADTKISALTDATTVGGTDELPIVQSATTKRATAAELKTYIEGNLAADTIDTITEIAAALRTGSDTKLVTGTAGTNGKIAMWNTDGDVVDSTATLSGLDTTIITGTAGGTDQGAKWNADGDLVVDTKTKYITFSATDTTTDLATGDAKAFVTIPAGLNGYNITAVQADVVTAGTTGTMDIQLHNITAAADILSTKLTIDSAETSSSTAATAAVIDAAQDDLTTGDRIRFDIDAVHTTPAKGLFITLTCTLP
jgi:hypothetical protein